MKKAKKRQAPVEGQNEPDDGQEEQEAEMEEEENKEEPFVVQDADIGAAKVSSSNRFEIGAPELKAAMGAQTPVQQIVGALGGSNAIAMESVINAAKQDKTTPLARGNEGFEAMKAKLLGVPVANPSQQDGQYVFADDNKTGGKSLQFVRQNENMHAMQDLLGKFFQFQGDRSKPLQQNLSMFNGMGFSGATADNIMQTLSNPDMVPNADNIPGSISNLNPAFQEKARQFRSFIEGMPVTAIKELRHPRHMYEQVPRDPLINMIHLDSQRRRVENFYAFI